MENIYGWGLEVIRHIQTIENPPLTIFMKGLSIIGSDEAYFVLLPLLFWCVDERRGMRLGTAVVLSGWLNYTLKDFWAQPRPYQLDPSVGLSSEKSYGLPSGHAQGSLTFWGILGSWLRAPAGIILAMVATLVISFSRVYLGVHFPTDIFAGWLLGGIVLAIYFIFGDFIAAAFNATNIRFRVLLIALIAFVMNALLPSNTGMGGVFLGLGLGYILMTARFPFSAARAADGTKPKIPNLIVRYLLGIVVAAFIYVGLKFALPVEGSDWYALGRFIRYALLGGWVAAGAPWIFLKLKLAGSR